MSPDAGAPDGPEAAGPDAPDAGGSDAQEAGGPDAGGATSSGAADGRPPLVHTIGHSTRSSDELAALLRECRIDLLVDVRSYPGSRRHPQFDRDALERALPEAGIEYRHEPSLGGRRRPSSDSPNTAWRSPGFRAYADHMASEEFREALGRLLQLGRARRPAIMCAEGVPWRCHRQLIADALVAAGADVRHILGPARAEPHELSEHARTRPDGTLVYPAPGDEQLQIL